MRIRKIKKIIVILIIIAMLQTQFVSLTNVVWAINMEMTGETGETELGTDMSGEVSTDTTVSEDVIEELPEEGIEENASDMPQENLDEVAPEDIPEEIPEETPEVIPEEEMEETFEESPGGAEQPVVEPKIELNITSENSSIYKGYLYANATSDLRYETNYNTIEELKIEGSQNGITSLVVKENEDKIKMITATKMALLNGIYYKKTRVSVDEFNSLLGENGLINIFDADGDFVGYIDNQSPVENGCYVYEFIYYTNSVKFELSSPVADGTIRIINDKAIKEDSLYSREQITTFSAINIMANAEMTVGENVLTASGEGDINLQETESKIEFELDKTELSTENENELTMTLTLKTDAERYELFENPVMEIEMPSNINEVTIDGINLLYKNGLSLKNWEVIENDNGNKVLRIEMEGAQSVYTPGIVGQGTTLVVYLKANVNKLTANTSETLKLRYTNQDSVRQSYILEGKDAEEILLTFVAKHGMLKGATATNITTSVLGSSYEDEVDKVEIKSEVGEQTVTVIGTIVNNFEKEVEDVVIVGRIPFVGNKNGNGDELLSDFNTILKSEVTTSGNMTDVYYSENGDATIDDDSWSQDTTDMSKYKSFKIVVREGTLNKGEKVEFTYDVTVPENLGYNLKSYATYSVIYKLDNQELFGNCTIALVTETKELEADDMENQEVVEKLKIGTQVTQGGRVLTEEDSVYERQVLRYTVVVTNTSNETLTNIKLNGRAENANLYTWKYYENENYFGNEIYISREYKEDVDGIIGKEECLIEKLEPGESEIFEYQVIVKALPIEVEEFETNVYGIVSIAADGIEEKYIETVKNIVKDAELELRVEKNGTEDLTGKDYQTNSGMSFAIYMKNISDGELENINLNVLIPRELDVNVDEIFEIIGAEDCGIKEENTENGKVIMFTIPKLLEGSVKIIYINTIAKSMDYTIAQNDIIISAYAETEIAKYISNDYVKTIYQGETKLEYTWESSVMEDIVEDGKEIVFDLILENIGIIDAESVFVESELPSGLELQEVKVIDSLGENDGEKLKTEYGNDYINENTHIKAGEKSTIKIITKVNKELFERDQETLEVKAKISGGRITTFETDVISYKINNENITVEIPKTEDDDNDEEMDDVTNNNQNDENVNDSLPNDTQENNNLQNPENQIVKPDEKEENMRTYMISGKVWLDQNKDGINKNESGMNSVIVMLYKTTDKGNITTMVKQDVTDNNGEYEFSLVEDGNYVVVFSYDTSIYNSTKYHVSTATSAENSDAITKAINLGNSKIVVGITDVIKINGSGAINVDFGLVNKNEFDLSLEKYIDSATVTNKEGTKTYKYEEKKNVKLEIHSKYYKDSTIDITYKIRIKNAGEVIGYINKIVDYVPEEMKFNNDKNPDWYYGDDGNLYYKGLVGSEIAPGTTKEITLVLTKVLDSGEAIKIRNSAEIAEYTNSIGLLDIDSTANNKEIKEDDFGEVILTIAISTGSTVQNILVMILTLSIIAIIVYISKLKFTKKVYR